MSGGLAEVPKEAWVDYAQAVAQVFALAGFAGVQASEWDAASHAQAVSWAELFAALGEALRDGSEPRPAVTAGEILAELRAAGAPFTSVESLCGARELLDATLLGNVGVAAQPELLATVVAALADPQAALAQALQQSAEDAVGWRVAAAADKLAEAGRKAASEGEPWVVAMAREELGDGGGGEIGAAELAQALKALRENENGSEGEGEMVDAAVRTVARAALAGVASAGDVDATAAALATMSMSRAGEVAVAVANYLAYLSDDDDV
ncbi:uncharacterized protein AMSG_01426 [Thecamonas trahens ATCC 50062]|uniref:Uncharacterized protein n=1 Tax=Thecamonas trahens ATCC 50062 TaxID=461836 RepID=A0A0L0DN81_THETB|nr:hypothetical protein AMSG_01426 [Thecamonas trahens ATCC 50062]KNC53715.1 hypothetical protein AMSG_01426 [Thecamonas trahens ATCC 50062]|eukprot:XP_013762029.1 hypothetical protein AMSG_01426 [Thecamonas trahens ATCC 50062]